jgi:fatty acid desaturase
VVRLVWEYALSLLLWTVGLGTVLHFGVGQQFAVAYLVPAILAGNLQSLRKFTEHMGLLGDDVVSTTRTVVDTSLLGRLLSASLLHIDLHGPHHLHAKIPHFNLPEATPVAYEKELSRPRAGNVYASYFSAMREMFETLGDPRVGVQWLRGRTRRNMPDRASQKEGAFASSGTRASTFSEATRF